MVFVEPSDPDREVWTGARMGPSGATARTGIPARPIAALRMTLDSILARDSVLFVVGNLESPAAGIITPDAQYAASVAQEHAGLRVADATSHVAKLRGTKSPAELALITKAAAITVDAERAAMATVAPGLNEFEVQARIEYTFRRDGADRPSFASIVGSGPNSTTLHYNSDDRFMADGELVVMDVGASYQGYAADVTRTVPVSGSYSPDQRAIYQLVRDAQAAAERQATVGAVARLMNDSATATLAAGLTKLGLIESPTATYDCGVNVGDNGARNRCPQYTLYYMHGLGHGIGLDVHDPEQFYYTGRIGTGSAFTIEPGLYVRANLAAILPQTTRNRAMLAAIGPAITRYGNIGVRIEDDYLAIGDHVERVSTAPREMSEIEAAMRQRPPSDARDSTKIDWYPRKRPGERGV
jgi:Xaa-Pro aminopeptidase